MKVLFITGFPGFIGKRLMGLLIGRGPWDEICFLVQDKLLAQAQQEIEQLKKLSQHVLLSVEVGDITKEDLGLGDRYPYLTHKVTDILHMAAIYSFTVPYDLCHEINVLGTEHILMFAKRCCQSIHLYYFSTCYVSGCRTGRIMESDLDGGQGFKNYYEATKFEAEIHVQNAMKVIPTTIFRPSIVVGDSTTGETDKYDGPYYFIRFLLKHALPMIKIGKSVAKVNIIPVDYLVNTVGELMLQKKTLGHVFQIADPSPLTSQEIVAEICQQLGRPFIPIRVPRRLAEAALKFQMVESFTGIPRNALPYFNHEASYDTTNTAQFLSGTSIRCPNFRGYLPNLIQFVKNNLDRQNMAAKY